MENAVDDFEEYIFASFAQEIANWTANDIYAVAIEILNDQDDQRRPMASLFNTTFSVWELNRNKPRDSDEAKWSLAYWEYQPLVMIGASYEVDDEKGRLLRRKWIDQYGLWFDDAYYENHLDNALKIGHQIGQHFDELCMRVALRLHPVFRTHLNKDLPILFFDRESMMVPLTREANAAELLTGYNEYVARYGLD